MKRTLRSHTPVIAIGAIAISLSAAGTVTAKTLLDGGDIKNESITTRDIRNGTIAVRDLSPRARLALKGPAGAQGAKGDTGAVGPAGSVGAAGARGAAGTTGAQGATGSTGATGGRGLQGEKGDRGEQGTTGLQGKPGDEGKQGLPGAPGVSGKPGDQGLPGEPGKPGDPGKQGLPGAPGESGKPGEKGDKGDPGSPGPATQVAKSALRLQEVYVTVRENTAPLVRCGRDETPISGGFEIVRGRSGAESLRVVASYPELQNSGWRFALENTTPEETEARLVVTCLRATTPID